MATLKLAIPPTDASPGWKASWSVDGVDVGAPILVDGRLAQGINAVARDFEKLFEPDALGQPRRPLVEPSVLRATGRVLFETWFAPVWGALDLGGGQHRLLIQSADHRVLNLPWELVELGDGLPLGCDAAWSLLRTSLYQRWLDPALLMWAHCESSSSRPPRSIRRSSTSSGKRTRCSGPRAGSARTSSSTFPTRDLR